MHSKTMEEYSSMLSELMESPEYTKVHAILDDATNNILKSERLKEVSLRDLVYMSSMIGYSLAIAEEYFEEDQPQPKPQPVIRKKQKNPRPASVNEKVYVVIQRLNKFGATTQAIAAATKRSEIAIHNHLQRLRREGKITWHRASRRWHLT
jgi:hypothetical protein